MTPALSPWQPRLVYITLLLLLLQGNSAPALAAPGLGAKSKQIEAELQAILVARGVTLKQLETSPNAVEPAQQASG